jgi:hypothetical protein
LMAAHERLEGIWVAGLRRLDQDAIIDLDHHDRAGS